MAEATNTGFEPLIRQDVPALRRSRLNWVKQNFVRAETLTAANAVLVAAQNEIQLACVWGGGEVASADGLRFVVPIRTIHSGPNLRYFGRERGVTPVTTSPPTNTRGWARSRCRAPCATA